MPAPVSAVMKMAAKAKFAANGLMVPSNWKQPVGTAAEHFGKAFKDDEKITAPDTMVPPLFLPATMNKYHTKTQKDLNAQFASFIDKTCDAISAAFDNWHKLASIAGIVIVGPVATGGIVTGPPLEPLILAQGAKETPNLAKYTATVASVVSAAFLAYTLTIKVPGLPLYPAYAVWAGGPAAMGVPNVPVPMIALGPAPGLMAAPALKSAMIGKHADPMAPYNKELFDCLATAIAASFVMWQGTTQMTGVIGAGPVPSMAIVPVPVPGPVTGGTVIPKPGCFV